jgi:Transposase
MRASRGGAPGACNRRRGQASLHPGHDVLSGTLGAAAELARNGPLLPNQLGSGLPLGAVVCAVGAGTPQTGSVTGIGIDEIHWGQGKRAAAFLTVIYQIDSGCRRLLWVGPKRTQATLKRGLQSPTCR